MRTTHRRIRSKIDRGERAFGVAVQLASPDVVEMVGYTGYDYVWIDAEHGTMGINEIGNLVRAADAAGIDAIVRVPDLTASFIQRVLDTGATGIMAPHIRTVQDANDLVRACKFAPEGLRGACPTTRAVGHLSQDWPTDYRSANDDVLVFGLIEDPEGVENVEEIASLGGLNGIVFGPFDLAMASGLEGNIGHPDVLKMRERVVEAVRSAGIDYVAISGWEAGGAEGIVRSGARLVTVTGDRGALFQAYSTALARSRSSLEAAAANATLEESQT
jgi:2-keto-3-deoxy-L-rhamnonate aldolase RhmA